MRDIRSYVRFYLGGPCLFGDKYGWITDLDEFGSLTVKVMGEGAKSTDFESIKLILRQFNTITRDELIEWAKISTPSEDFETFIPEDIDGVLTLIKQEGLEAIDFCSMDDNRLAFEFCRWATNKGFDLFGLIADGLAIDENTLKQTKENA